MSSSGPVPGGVLLTRLLPPRLPPGCLPRLDLVARAAAGLRGRLLLIAAGAGYGKSTLLAQALAASPEPAVWVSCDERMAGARDLVAHIAAGLARRFPGVGARLALEGSDAEQVGELCNEVVAVLPDDFVLAFDDVHSLAGTPAAATLELLARDLPPQVHLAMATRGARPFPLGRLRAAGVVELGEAELALDAADSALLARASGRELTDAQATELHRRTEGWAAGLILAVRAPGPLPGPGESGTGGESPPFDFLAEEVFARQPERTRRILIDLSVLERFTPALAEAVTGRPEARGLVERLVNEHLFGVRLATEGDWYRFHHLFHAFLRRQLEGDGEGEPGKLHRRAAAAWLEAGEPAEAVRHLLWAGDLDAAAAALEPLAEGMVAGGEGRVVAGWLEAIPRERWRGRPGLLLASSTLRFNRSEFHAALDDVAPAVEELIAAGDHERAATALFRLLHYLATVGGAHDRGIEAGQRHLPRIAPDTRMLPVARIRMAALYAYANRHDELESELRAAEALPATLASPTLATYAAVARAFYIDHPRGRTDAGLATIDEAIEQLERNMAADVLRYLPYARAYRGVLLNDLGRYEETLAEAERLVEAIERRNMARMGASAVAWMRFGALAGLERAEDLDAELRRTAPLFEGPGGAVRGYHYPMAAARLAAQTGDAHVALARVATARAALRAHGYAYEEAQGLSDLTLVAVRVGDAELARELARDALAAGEVARSPSARARAALVGAVAWDGDEGLDDGLLGEALAQTATADLRELWTRKERARAGALLARALERGLGPPGTARDLLAAAGGDVLAEAGERLRDAAPPVRAALAELAGDAQDVGVDTVARLARDTNPAVRRAARGARVRLSARPRPPVRLHTLGGFWVERAGVRVPDPAFGRRKARTLLAVLVTAGATLHRESLIETLWPDLSLQRGVAALHTTLHALRRALEPGLERGGASSLVVADGPTYRLALAADDRWDAGEFLALARTPSRETPEQELGRLEAAEAAYGGAFLPEWPYEEWAATRREEVEDARREVLHRLAQRLLADGRPDAAIGPAQRLVALQPEREAWHRLLMRSYHGAGERALALRQYHDCRARLREQLDLAPGEETRALYAEILADEPGGLAARALESP